MIAIDDYHYCGWEGYTDGKKTERKWGKDGGGLVGVGKDGVC